MMNTGLDSHITEKIRSVFRKFPQIEQAVLYGSRAIGSYKPGSDIDICLKGNNLNQELVWKVSATLDDLLLPYIFDLAVLDDVDNPELKEHISRVGIDLYSSR